jgi:hypothetical protein
MGRAAGGTPSTGRACVSRIGTRALSEDETNAVPCGHQGGRSVPEMGWRLALLRWSGLLPGFSPIRARAAEVPMEWGKVAVEVIFWS